MQSHASQPHNSPAHSWSAARVDTMHMHLGHGAEAHRTIPLVVCQPSIGAHLYSVCT